MSKKVRILVLEDDDEMRELLADVLTGRGYEVVAAGGGEEALSLARQERFDLIVADIRMEGMTGLDAIERAQEHQPNMGSLVISGYASEEETLRAVRLKVGGYLKKPFKMQQLLAHINDIVARRAEEAKRLEDARTLREAFRWSLQSLSTLGGRLEGEWFARTSEIAHGVASHLSLAGDGPNQLKMASILDQLEAHLNMPLPVRLRDSLIQLKVLRPSNLESDPIPLARLLGEKLKQGENLPEPGGLDFGPELQEAYRKWLDSGEVAEDGESDDGGVANLVYLARALEQSRKFEAAQSTYEEVLGQQSRSHNALSAHLRLARVASALGDRAGQEKSVQEALTVAERLGPVSLALAELEAGEVLARGEHPSTAKLLTRAVKSLESVRLEVPWAVAVLQLADLDDRVSSAVLEKAVAAINSPSNLSEVMENLPTVMTFLLKLAGNREDEFLQQTASRLVNDYPQVVAGTLTQQRLNVQARSVVLSVLEKQQQGVDAELLAQLTNDPDPEIVARATRLTQGRSAIPVLRVYSMGSPQVYLGEHELSDEQWKSLKIKHLFFYLASRGGDPLLVENLMEQFWPGPLENARSNLNSAVSSIRKYFRELAGDENWDPVPREKDALRIDPKLQLWHDYEEFNKAYAGGRKAMTEGNPKGAVASFRRAARLYRGPYLDGCYMEWALTIRRTLESKAGEALEHLVEHCLSAESHREALEYAERFLQLFPEKQEAHHLKMKAHIGLGQPELAIKQYERCARMLARDYDLEPNTDLLRTYHQARYGLGGPSNQLIG